MPSYSAHTDFDPDKTDRPAVALHLELKDYATEIPAHRHRKGQLVLALHGAVTCHVADGWWIVPANCGVWIPGAMEHSNFTTANAQLSFLFVEPDAAALPAQCCTFSVSPMIREMIGHLAKQAPDYETGSHTDRLVRVLLDELVRMPKEDFHLPISEHPKIRKIAEGFANNPADRSTLAQWAERIAVSERSLARLMLQETGMTFGRWRQQFHLMLALREISAGVSVQNVSAILGYESVTAFITMFKKALGQTPTRYLPIHKNK